MTGKTEIDLSEEFTTDWDWFAVDAEGRIGHFTTAGMRSLPRTVKQDKEATLALIDYFGKAPKSIPYVVRPEAKRDADGWPNDAARSWYLRDFIQMASAGLFSYDTYTDGRSDYFLVAFPISPLRVDQLPLEIRDLVIRVKSPLAFSKSTYISEVDTRDW